MFMLYLDAGYRPGCMMLRIHHAEIFLESGAYGDGFSLSPASNIAAKVGCYKVIARSSGEVEYRVMALETCELV